MKEGRVAQVWVPKASEFKALLERTLNEHLAKGWELGGVVNMSYVNNLEAFLVFTREKQQT